MASEVSKEDRLLAALSYPFWPLAFLILNLSPVLKRQRFLRYHAFQAFFLGMTLWVGMVVLGTVAGFLGRFLWPIGVLYYLLSKVLGVATLLVVAWCSFQAWMGQEPELPQIGRWARDFADEPCATLEEPGVPAEEPPAPAEEAPRVARDLVERIPTEPSPSPSRPRRRQSPPGAPSA